MVVWLNSILPECDHNCLAMAVMVVWHDVVLQQAMLVMLQ